MRLGGVADQGHDDERVYSGYLTVTQLAAEHSSCTHHELAGDVRGGSDVIAKQQAAQCREEEDSEDPPVVPFLFCSHLDVVLRVHLVGGLRAE